ncbi:MAG: hypothetical protein JZU53_06895 [Paludibacter sp.]|nr:hypothetical protein [Paludibacter sp.]
MKTIMDFLKNNWLLILIALVIVIVFAPESGNKSDKYTKIAVNHAIDSMKNENANALIAQYDSLSKLHEGKAQASKIKAVEHKTKSSKQKLTSDTLTAKYEANPTLPGCDSLLQSKNIEIAEKDSVIKHTETEATEYSQALQDQKEINVQKDVKNELLINENERNKKVINDQGKQIKKSRFIRFVDKTAIVILSAIVLIKSI